MASFFNLKLDTTAPEISLLKINDGDLYTSIVTVGLTITVADLDVHQMKIWGTAAAASELDATWETFAASKNVTLPAGDGLKTVYIKVRDDVENESVVSSASITLDTALPIVTITGPDRSKISKVAGMNTAAISFMSNVAFVEYKIKVVPSETSLHDAGVQIPTTGGSTNMAGTGSFPADVAINSTINAIDLDAASSGDGVKIVKIFVKTASGVWNN